jgi:hypothetical protein
MYLRKEILQHSDKMNLLCDMYLNELYASIVQVLKKIAMTKEDSLLPEEKQFLRYLQNKMILLQKNAETRVTFTLDDFLISQFELQNYENFIKTVLSWTVLISSLACGSPRAASQQ